VHEAHLREGLRATPVVERQNQGATHPHIVERLSLMVNPGSEGVIPVALLHDELVANLFLQALVWNSGPRPI
jgi:hypothetical protein